jgi:uncharacterized membrane protein HdeD (DUF308 family)
LYEKERQKSVIKLFKQELRLLKTSWITLLVTGIGILGFGIIVAIYPQYASPNQERLVQTIGVATTGMGIFGIMITLNSFRRKERWAWFTLWYYPIFWIIHFVGRLPPGNDHIHQVIFIILSLLGLLLPVRQFFPRRMV